MQDNSSPNDSPFALTPQFFGAAPPAPPSALNLDIAYESPKRPIKRVVLQATGTLDGGYDDIEVIRADQMGSFGFDDVGVHIYINSKGVIQWGRSLNKPPLFPHFARDNDVVILIHGYDISLEINALKTLRALLPVINAVHENQLVFEGLTKHHARLGIDRDGRLIDPALQEPPVL